MESYKRLLRFVRPYWIRLVAATVLGFGVSGINGAVAWLVKPVLDDILVKKDLKMWMLLPLGILVLSILKGLFAYANTYLMNSVGSKIVRDIRNKLYHHTIFLPVSFYSKDSTGTLISRILNDAGMFQGLLAFSIKDLIVEGTTVIALTAVAFYRRWDLALVAVTVFPLSFYAIGRFGKKMRRISKKGQEQISGITTILSDTLSGIKVIKAFGMERNEKERFENETQGYYRISMKGVRLKQLSSLFMEVVAGTGIAFVIWYGGYLAIVKNTLTPGDFVSFLVAIVMVYTPLKRLSDVYNSIQQARASAERVFYLMDAEKERDGTIELQPLKDAIEFRNVSFSYERDNRKVVDNINLRIKAGEVIAIVGKSGAGKTTIADLIPRFYSPLEGQILFDSIDIKDATLRSLRSQIGIVSQDVILFNDTVKNNIAYGMPAATDEEIVNAAKAAFAHDFITEMPVSYDTVIGERGLRLSGGQRQRISIARAILKNPPILILDEATSSLDTASEMMVQRALENLMKGRTTIIIAHRLSTIKRADRVIVLDRGRIIETGTHDELLGKGGTYKNLYTHQFEEKKRDVSPL